MHSEHLSNLHPGWVVAGFLVAIAATSVAYLGMVGAGLFPEGPGAVLGIAAAIAVGFFVGGMFVGIRWSDAPILHGGAMTLLSVVVWFAGTVALPGRMGLRSSETAGTLGLLLLQLCASTGGAWAGRRIVLGGGRQPSREEGD